jgi:sugar/nucleoside kinase (ribokinase family)
VLGGDEDGRLMRAGFAEFGVDDSCATVVVGGVTDFTVILLDDSGERTILVVPTLPSPPPLTDSALAALRATRLAYTVPHRRDWFAPVADAVHSGGGLVALDVETSSPVQGADLAAAVDQSDIIFCNRRGLKLMTGVEEAPVGARALLERGLTCVVVTLGAEGAYAVRHARRVRSGVPPVDESAAPGYRVPVADTTGAGDCFHAAFLCGWLASWPLEQTLRFANAAAALSVQKLGPRAGFPTRSEVETFLASQPA